MQLLPMDAPAEIHRRATPGASQRVVARGPLVIMAHGLMALAPDDRAGCWISCEGGNLTPGDAEEALRRWLVPPARH